MAITKKFLVERLQSLQQQADTLLRQKLMVDGAIQDCKDMISKLEEEEKEEVEDVVEN